MNEGKSKKKHCTASIFIFHKTKEKWKLLLVHHKEFDLWMIPGGHVEQNENPVEAVLREANEETNSIPHLVSFLHASLEDTDSTWLLPPEYLFEQRIPARADEDEHFHIDCAYIGLVDSEKVSHRVEESNAIQWFSEKEVTGNTSMFLSTQRIALDILKKLNVGARFSYEQEVQRPARHRVRSYNSV